MSHSILVRAEDLENLDSDPLAFLSRKPLKHSKKYSSKNDRDFHLVMRQLLMGIPGVDAILEANSRLKEQVECLRTRAPELLAPLFADGSRYRRCHEQRQSKVLGIILLEHTYDLVITCEQDATLVDWTTNEIDARPVGVFVLEQSWHTRLARFVFAESSDYAPEQVTMSFWSVNEESPGATVQLTWDEERHERVRTDLKAAVLKMQNPEPILPNTNSFPAWWFPDLDEIPEVPI